MTPKGKPLPVYEALDYGTVFEWLRAKGPTFYACTKAQAQAMSEWSHRNHGRRIGHKKVEIAGEVLGFTLTLKERRL